MPQLPALVLAAARNLQWLAHCSQNQVLDSDAMLLHVQERALAKSGAEAGWRGAFFLPAGADAGVWPVARRCTTVVASHHGGGSVV